MSWAVEEWKEGLPTRALQKIQELEGQLDKLKKEKQQRQFQLETLEAVLQKQKQKVRARGLLSFTPSQSVLVVEDEKTEGINLKRENQSLMEICENLEKAKQKISHDLQVKESQVNFQEGQLNSSKKQIERLEQELKRHFLHEPSDGNKTVFTCLCSGSKYEDLKEKYDKEVEERKRLEAEVKVLQANVSSPRTPAVDGRALNVDISEERLCLQRASQPLPQSTMNHRDIARHQASSSVFWPQEATPGRLSTALRTPSRREFSAEPEGTPSRWTLQTGNRDANSSFCDNSSNSQLLDQLKAQNQEHTLIESCFLFVVEELRSKIHDLELRLQGQEKELKGQGNKFHELHLQLEKAKVELMEKEKVLNKSRDELVRTTAQYDQASAKSAALEQKLKKLTEDLSCQRQNAENARRSLEQRSKEKEKEFQEVGAPCFSQELCRQQRALQSLEQEGAQVKARLTQELQQARSAHGSLQAELDRVGELPGLLCPLSLGAAGVTDICLGAGWLELRGAGTGASPTLEPSVMASSGAVSNGNVCFGKTNVCLWPLGTQQQMPLRAFALAQLASATACGAPPAVGWTRLSSLVPGCDLGRGLRPGPRCPCSRLPPGLVGRGAVAAPVARRVLVVVQGGGLGTSLTQARGGG
ncbi:Centromere protein F [Galemys pyrenaicus]|uniref:Centromere protein F n=1 Tax=Galemys pyrenaicus TaxID=202257 RepID=A0A8J5ZM00_GALPY|nr:Centromere protein F [Galemys pyrenaicus]